MPELKLALEYLPSLHRIFMMEDVQTDLL